MTEADFADVAFYAMSLKSRSFTAGCLEEKGKNVHTDGSEFAESAKRGESCEGSLQRVSHALEEKLDLCRSLVVKTRPYKS